MITGNLNVIPDAILTLEFSILYLKDLNIYFPLMFISLHVYERLLLLSMTSVIVGVNEQMLKLMP